MTVQEPTTGNARPHEGDVEDRLQMGTDMLVWIRRGRTMRLELQGCGRGTGSLASALARLSQRSVWRTAGGAFGSVAHYFLAASRAQLMRLRAWMPMARPC